MCVHAWCFYRIMISHLRTRLQGRYLCGRCRQAGRRTVNVVPGSSNRPRRQGQLPHSRSRNALPTSLVRRDLRASAVAVDTVRCSRYSGDAGPSGATYVVPESQTVVLLPTCYVSANRIVYKLLVPRQNSVRISGGSQTFLELLTDFFLLINSLPCLLPVIITDHVSEKCCMFLSWLVKVTVSYPQNCNIPLSTHVLDHVAYVMFYNSTKREQVLIIFGRAASWKSTFLKARKSLTCFWLYGIVLPRLVPEIGQQPKYRCRQKLFARHLLTNSMPLYNSTVTWHLKHRPEEPDCSNCCCELEKNLVLI